MFRARLDFVAMFRFKGFKWKLKEDPAFKIRGPIDMTKGVNTNIFVSGFV